MHASETSTASHLERLGLSREPFADAPDDSFFLLDSQRAQHLNTLYHLTQHGNTPVLITGCKGSGKTSLISKFLAMGTSTWRYCLVRANAMMNPEQLLRHIADGFGIEPDSINFDNAFDSLRQRFIELHRSGLIAILIIDDAQDLPAASLSVLIKLSELQDEAHNLLRILLFSEEQIINVLASAEPGDMQQRITQTLEMPALNERQTMDYIRYRLGVAGAGETIPLSRGQMKQIYRQSNGLPLQINQVARAVLLDHGDSGSTGMQRRTLFITIGLLGAIGLLGLFLAQETFNLSGQDEQTTTVTLELPAPRTPVTGQSAAEPPAPSLVAPEGEALRQPVPSPAKPGPETGTAGQSDLESATQPLNIIEKQDVIETPVTLSSPAVGWFDSLDPAHFTLQLIASRNRPTVEGLRQQHQLGTQSAIIATQHKGRDWFVLVYGSYPDKDTARAAISSLPAPLQQAGPWPRRIGDLQNSP